MDKAGDDIAELRAELAGWRATANMYEATAREEAKGLECLSDIDDAWEAFGSRGNRKALTLAEQIGSLLREMEGAEADRDDARRKLFPYADATEISGMSWNGFYLIGDEKSVKELRRIEHRSAQLEQFSRAFDLEKQIASRQAFKAGWRTNTTTEQPSDYLDGCEGADWEAYKAIGLDGYLSALASAEDDMSEVCIQTSDREAA